MNTGVPWIDFRSPDDSGGIMLISCDLSEEQIARIKAAWRELTDKAERDKMRIVFINPFLGKSKKKA
jgi:hypothetical protein